MTAVSEDMAGLELKVTWSNSWRNEINQDAVYLFGKYRTPEQESWEHVFFPEEKGEMEVSPGFELQVVNGRKRGGIVPEYRRSGRICSNPSAEMED